MTDKPKRPEIPPPSRAGIVFYLWEQIRLAWRLLLDSRMPIILKVIPLFALAYALSPIDLIPEYLIGVGWMDDAGLLLLAVALFNGSAPDGLWAEHMWQLRRGHFPPTGEDADTPAASDETKHNLGEPDLIEHLDNEEPDGKQAGSRRSRRRDS
jgi:uncharacterized membrane protein YkvA (DUF1232 family)